MKAIKVMALSVIFGFAISGVNVYAAKTSDDGPVELQYESTSLNKKGKTKRVNREEYEELQKQKVAFNESMRSCRVRVEPLRDERQNQQTLGSTFAKPLLIKPIDNWLKAFKQEGIDKALAEYQTQDAGIVLTPSVTRLYAYAENMNIHGVIAIKVDISMNGQFVGTRRYRGLGSRANMVNGVGEYHDAVNRAADDAVAVLIADLPSICGVEVASR